MQLHSNQSFRKPLYSLTVQLIIFPFIGSRFSALIAAKPIHMLGDYLLYSRPENMQVFFFPTLSWDGLYPSIFAPPLCVMPSLPHPLSSLYLYLVGARESEKTGEVMVCGSNTDSDVLFFFFTKSCNGTCMSPATVIMFLGLC